MLPQPTPESVMAFGQLEFLDGLRTWHLQNTGSVLTNYLLADLALVTLSTVEGWRVAPGLPSHRALSARDRVLILLRLIHGIMGRRPGNATSPRWEPAEDAIIAERYPNVGASGLVALLPGRTANAIALRANRLGVERTRSMATDPTG